MFSSNSGTRDSVGDPLKKYNLENQLGKVIRTETKQRLLFQYRRHIKNSSVDVNMDNVTQPKIIFLKFTNESEEDLFEVQRMTCCRMKMKHTTYLSSGMTLSPSGEVSCEQVFPRADSAETVDMQLAPTDIL